MRMSRERVLALLLTPAVQHARRLRRSRRPGSAPWWCWSTGWAAPDTITVFEPQRLLERRVLDANRLVRYRPWLYHLTDVRNLVGIRQEWTLKSAAAVFAEAGEPDQVRVRRPTHRVVVAKEGEVYVRDQAPLHEGNIALAEGFSYSDLIELINSFVFFWPGDHQGPSAYGRRHFARYRHEGPVILRIRTRDLIDSGAAVHLCRYNSGAPRCSQGRGSPRGPDTFAPIRDFAEGVASIVEVVVPQRLSLPGTVEIAESPSGPFTLL